MGFEYQFTLIEQDIDNLSRCPDGINSLDKLLSSAPGFVGKNNSVYAYTDQPDNDNHWQSTVHLNADGFCLCIYQRTVNSLDQQLLNFLMQELLKRCGRLEIEDA